MGNARSHVVAQESAQEQKTGVSSRVWVPLPADIMSALWNFLPVKDLGNCPCVCVQWRNVPHSKNNHIWKRLWDQSDESGFDKSEIDKYLGKTVIRGPQNKVEVKEVVAKPKRKFRPFPGEESEDEVEVEVEENRYLAAGSSLWRERIRLQCEHKSSAKFFAFDGAGEAPAPAQIPSVITSLCTLLSAVYVGTKDGHVLRFADNKIDQITSHFAAVNWLVVNSASAVTTASCSVDGNLQVHRGKDRVLDITHQTRAYSLALLADRFVFVGMKDQIRGYSCTRGELVCRLEDEHQGLVTALAVGQVVPDLPPLSMEDDDDNGYATLARQPHGFLVSGGRDCTVRLWALPHNRSEDLSDATGYLLGRHSGPLQCVRWLGQGALHVSAGVRVLSNSSSSALVLSASAGEVQVWAWSPLPPTKINAKSFKSVCLYTLCTGDNARIRDVHIGAQYIAVCLSVGIRIWDVQSGVRLTTLLTKNSSAGVGIFEEPGKPTSLVYSEEMMLKRLPFR